MVPPGKWLGINAILWGIITASTASIRSYHGLLVTRILVGIFEAALSPCLMLIIGKDFTGPHRIFIPNTFFCHVQGCGIHNQKPSTGLALGFVDWVWLRYSGVLFLL